MALSVALIVKAHVGQLGHPPPSSPGKSAPRTRHQRS